MKILMLLFALAINACAQASYVQYLGFVNSSSQPVSWSGGSQVTELSMGDAMVLGTRDEGAQEGNATHVVYFIRLDVPAGSPFFTSSFSGDFDLTALGSQAVTTNTTIWDPNGQFIIITPYQFETVLAQFELDWEQALADFAQPFTEEAYTNGTPADCWDAWWDGWQSGSVSHTIWTPTYVDTHTDPGTSTYSQLLGMGMLMESALRLQANNIASVKQFLDSQTFQDVLDDGLYLNIQALMIPPPGTTNPVKVTSGTRIRVRRDSPNNGGGSSGDGSVGVIYDDLTSSDIILSVGIASDVTSVTFEAIAGGTITTTVTSRLLNDPLSPYVVVSVPAGSSGTVLSVAATMGGVPMTLTPKLNGDPLDEGSGSVLLLQ